MTGSTLYIGGVYESYSDAGVTKYRDRTIAVRQVPGRRRLWVCIGLLGMASILWCSCGNGRAAASRTAGSTRVPISAPSPLAPNTVVSDLISSDPTGFEVTFQWTEGKSFPGKGVFVWREAGSSYRWDGIARDTDGTERGTFSLVRWAAGSDRTDF
ncbi:MAG TPA: hypothetical protein VIG47_15410, partial [Gemmatimonadaceae bacterium]